MAVVHANLHAYFLAEVDPATADRIPFIAVEGELHTVCGWSRTPEALEVWAYPTANPSARTRKYTVQLTEPQS